MIWSGVGIGQQVAGELLDDEPVERLVGVEGVDDPVAVGPGLAIVVEVQAVGVAVAGGVEPEPRHVLAVAGRVEQAVDDLLVSLLRRVGQERVDLRGGSAAGRSGRASRGGSAWSWRPSGDGESPSASSRARMNRSISLTAQPAFLTDGSAGFLGASNAQCVDQVAPCSTHRRKMATWSAVSCLPLFLGGMCRSGSSLSIRTISSLSSGLPGAIARPPSLSLANAPSFVSSRRPALRALSSGPWQAKQLIREDRPDIAREIDRARLGIARPAAAGSPSPRADRHDRQESRKPTQFADKTPCLPPCTGLIQPKLIGQTQPVGPPLWNIRDNVQEPEHVQRLSQGVPRRAAFPSARSGSPGYCGVVRSHGTRRS